MDSAGNVYIGDATLNRIQVFSGSGTYITKWGSSGTGDGQFNEPYGMAFDSVGDLYVLDTGNNRVEKFTRPANRNHRHGDLGEAQVPLPVTQPVS